MRNPLLLAPVFLLLLSAVLPSVAAESPVHGTLDTIGSGEDTVSVLKLWGTPYEMGYAHGKLCADRVQAFSARIVTAMCLGMGLQPSDLDKAWEQMRPFVAPRYLEEMRGLADGAGLDLQLVERAHAVPDVSEFHCTFFAAWGAATRDGHLHQIRALDYATQAGIQNEPALIVYRPDGRNPFVAVGWLGFIGCVTGMNAQHIALSEIGEHFSDEVETLDGEPMPFLMRRVLEDASDLQTALGIFRQAHRTSSYLYCVSDAKIPSARALRTSRDFCHDYAPEEFGALSLQDTVQWSMGCDSPWNLRLFWTLQAHHGQIDEQVGMMEVMRRLGTGNLHAVHFDVTDLELWVANATPGPEVRPAYDQDFVYFSLPKALDVAR
ncbi:MAG: hypothetical protein HPY69_15230 [Armatimonadetes bacterium]|nr:hypothetical protein [Armatimonadota bacterium]